MRESIITDIGSQNPSLCNRNPQNENPIKYKQSQFPTNGGKVHIKLKSHNHLPAALPRLLLKCSIKKYAKKQQLNFLIVLKHFQHILFILLLHVLRTDDLHSGSDTGYPSEKLRTYRYQYSCLEMIFSLGDQPYIIPSQGTPSPLAPSQAASAISCMVSRILTSPGRHHSGVSLFVRRFAQKAIAVAMLKCKPLFLFIFGPIILGLIRNPIWLDSGGLASSFSCQSAERLSDSNY